LKRNKLLDGFVITDISSPCSHCAEALKRID